MTAREIINKNFNNALIAGVLGFSLTTFAAFSLPKNLAILTYIPMIVTAGIMLYFLSAVKCPKCRKILSTSHIGVLKICPGCGLDLNIEVAKSN